VASAGDRGAPSGPQPTRRRRRAAARATGKQLRETPGVIMPPLVFLALSLWLGLATPSLLRDAWTAAANILFPTP